MGGRSSDDSPAYNAVAVTPADGTKIQTTRSLYIGGTGAVAVVMAGGASVTFAAVPVGVLSIQVNEVRSTGTTATNIIALY